MQITERRFTPPRRVERLPMARGRLERRGGRVAVVPLSSYPAARSRYFLGWFAGRLFCAGFDDVDLDLGDAFAGDAERFGGGRRDVHDAAANERAAVVDAHRHRASGIDVGDAQPRPER